VTRGRLLGATVFAVVLVGGVLALPGSGARTAPGAQPADVRVAAFVDHHVHLFNVGWWLRQQAARAPDHVDASAASESEVVARVVAARAATPRPSWITGFGWNQEAWSPVRMPTLDPLSEASPDVPVALARTDGHALWVNRAALRAAGLTAHGDSAVLLERETEPVVRLVPAPSDDDIVDAWRRGAAALAANGVARAYDAGVLALPGVAALNTDFARYARLLARADRERALPLELFLMIPAPSAFADSVLAMAPAERHLSPRVRVSHLKLFADGALGSRGAALSHAYADDPHTHGVLRMRAAEIAALTRRALDAGLDIATHAIGDAAVHEALDAYETVLRERPGTVPARLRIEHFSYASEDDFARAVRLGVALSIQSNFNAPRGTPSPTFAEVRVGREGAARVYAWDRLQRMGALLVEGSDHFGAPGEAFDGPFASLVGINALGERGDSPELRALVLRLHQDWLAPGGTHEPAPSALEVRDGAGRVILLSGDPLTVPLDSLRALRVRRAP